MRKKKRRTGFKAQEGGNASREMMKAPQEALDFGRNPALAEFAKIEGRKNRLLSHTVCRAWLKLCIAQVPQILALGNASH
jgi:hypothetical protein